MSSLLDWFTRLRDLIRTLGEAEQVGVPARVPVRSGDVQRQLAGRVRWHQDH